MLEALITALLVGAAGTAGSRGTGMAFDAFTSGHSKDQFQGGPGASAHMQVGNNPMNEAFVQMLLQQQKKPQQLPQPMMPPGLGAQRMWQQPAPNPYFSLMGGQ